MSRYRIHTTQAGKEKWLIAAAFIGVLAVAVTCERREANLIASGRCKQTSTRMYQPPPQQFCTMRNNDGICLVHTYIPRQPYEQTLWVCEEGEKFWRRSQ